MYTGARAALDGGGRSSYRPQHDAPRSPVYLVCVSRVSSVSLPRHHAPRSPVYLVCRLKRRRANRCVYFVASNGALQIALSLNLTLCVYVYVCMYLYTHTHTHTHMAGQVRGLKRRLAKCDASNAARVEVPVFFTLLALQKHQH
jgi:hypothetical protein